MREVACPVALHPDGAPRRITVFDHPLAGRQLVKGGIHPNEPPEKAAARALIEQSGLETRATLRLGTSTGIVENTRWHFTLCRLPGPVRDQWQHLSADDGGHLFRFSWIPLDTDDTSGLKGPFAAAFRWIRAAL